MSLFLSTQSSSTSIPKALSQLLLNFGVYLTNLCIVVLAVPTPCQRNRHATVWPSGVSSPHMDLAASH